MILEVDREKERVSLGLKQMTDNPWADIERKYPINSHVKGRVTKLLPYGAFVELEKGVEGLVHVSELSWVKRITRPSDVLKLDQEIEAVVLSISVKEQKISLGVRQLEDNPWRISNPASRSAPLSRARSATLLPTAPLWVWKKASTA